MSGLADLIADMTGVVVPYALSTAPDGWVLCDGQALPDAAPYKALRELLIADGSPYGVDGSDPRVPDLRGRVVAGKDDMGGAVAGRLTDAGTGNPGIDGATLGAAGGSDRHQLTVAQMPSHSHTQRTQDTAADGAARGTPFIGGTDYPEYNNINPEGDDEAHPNVQPTLVLNYIIRL